MKPQVLEFGLTIINSNRQIPNSKQFFSQWVFWTAPDIKKANSWNPTLKDRIRLDHSFMELEHIYSYRY